MDGVTGSGEGQREEGRKGGGRDVGEDGGKGWLTPQRSQIHQDRHPINCDPREPL